VRARFFHAFVVLLITSPALEARSSPKTPPGFGTDTLFQLLRIVPLLLQLQEREILSSATGAVCPGTLPFGKNQDPFAFASGSAYLLSVSRVEHL